MSDLTEIKEIIALSKAGRIRKLEDLIHLKKGLHKKTWQFYHEILEGKINSNEEAEKSLYPGKKSSSNYYMLKKRLREKLQTSVLFSEIDGGLDSQDPVFMYCHKNYVTGRLLLWYGSRDGGIPILKDVLKKALTYELYAIAELCILELKKDALVCGNDKYFKKLNSDLVIIREIIINESTAENLLQSVLLPFSRKVHPTNLPASILEHIELIEKLRKKTPTYNLINSLNRLKIIYCQFNGEHQKAIQICDEHLALLKTKRYYTPLRKGHFLIQKLDCLLLKRDFPKVKTMVIECDEIFRPGTGHWFLTYQLYLLISIN
jgi:hypothetical protein